MTEYVSHWGTRPSRLALLALLVGTYLPSGAAALSSCPTVPPKLRGGRLVVSLRSEPKTLNPVIALDAASRTVIERMSGDLLHIARDTQQVVPALAESWTVSRGGTRYTLKLRKNVLFSDGQPFTADDVLFSFQVYLDPKIHSPQRDLLVIGGVPMAVRKIDSHTVQFDLSQPYAAGERLFDTVTMLPRHLLKQPYEEGKLTDAWGLQTASKAIAGLGPFTLRSYVPGQQMVLSRNPYYWGSGACGEKLPHLDELVFLFAGSEAGQVMRFQAGEADVVSRIGADNYSLLEREADARGYRLHDLGPGMEYHFLLFNLNHVRGTNPAVEAKQ
jgi:peptide/nickel transport system substrate-binding protein